MPLEILKDFGKISHKNKELFCWNIIEPRNRPNIYYQCLKMCYLLDRKNVNIFNIIKAIQFFFATSDMKHCGGRCVLPFHFASF
jgi:hypothetical protein